MKKVLLFMFVLSLVIFASCTAEEIEKEKTNQPTQSNDPEKINTVDPEKVKPPTHG